VTLWERMQLEAALAELELYDPLELIGDAIYVIKDKLSGRYLP
jgi:hypothetical protein